MNKLWSFLFVALFVLMTSTSGIAATRLNLPDVYITVNTTSDVIDSADGLCSLREAVIAANEDASSGGVPGECPAGSGEDDIIVPFGVHRLSISGSGENFAATGDLDIRESVDIYGLGKHNSIIDSDVEDRIFHIPEPSITLRLYDLTVREGVVSSGNIGGAGIYIENGRMEAYDIIFKNNFIAGEDSGNSGGAIKAQGNFEVTDCLFQFNYAYRGGAISISGLVTDSMIKRSLFLYNISSNSGAINNYGVVTIQNSTFSQNETIETGAGAIFNHGTMILSFSTLVGNTAIVPNSFAHAGALLNHPEGTMQVEKSILANNRAYVDEWNNCYEYATFIPGTFNLVDDASCPFGASNYYNIDPHLGPLGNWGGPTQTYPLMKGSLAIDSAGNVGCPADDQRGVSRPLDGNNNSIATCDIGAYETDGNFSQIYVPFAVK